jgi:glycosyltransferase involved in cell wall biosynthesis
MKVSTATIITPCRNAERLVRRTAESIMAQTAVRSGRVRLQYLVCDGASTDRTADVVREVCGSAAEIVSEPDASLYEAVANGFRRATGDVVSYLNAGDLYSPTALDVVADVFEQQDVEWITGMVFQHNARGEVIRADLPYRYRKRFIRKGLYGSALLPFFITQEACFWSRRLLSLVDLDRLSAYRLAGDYYLWTCFAREAELVVVEAHLGGFAYEPGQLSQTGDAYARDLATFREPIGPLDFALAQLDRVVWYFAPPPLRKRLNPRGLLRYSPTEDRWR